MDNLIEVMWIDGIILLRLSPGGMNCIVIGQMYVMEISIKQYTKVWWQVDDLFLQNSRWQMLASHDFLLMGNSCLWGGLDYGTCWFPHPPGNLLYSAAFSTLYSIWATQRFGLSFLVWDSDGLGVIMSGKWWERWMWQLKCLFYTVHVHMKQLHGMSNELA